MTDLHPVLYRQLKHLGLSDRDYPSDPILWIAFLERVNHSYQDADQARYLAERSLSISANETRELNKKLINIAHQAGMADIATSILHNVGNVLNSMNVSLTLLKEKWQSEKLIESFTVINDHLKDHMHDLSRYLTEDNEGKHYINYLQLFGEVLKKERDSIKIELEALTKDLEHIKAIIETQKTISGVGGMIEPIFISGELEEALFIIGFDDTYKIEHNYEVKQKMYCDKNRLMQILLNLIRNAKDALIEYNPPQKILTLSASCLSSNKIQIKVKDNGIGIAPENIQKIFTFGYSTKPKGHGFGLNASILLASEMGGILYAESEGHGKGATFTLELPMTPIQDERPQ